MPAKIKNTTRKRSPAKKQVAQNPLILRYHRLMDAFSKSDDERDFYLDKTEGLIIFIDLSKSHKELANLQSELKKNPDRYCLIPKLTFYETKKIMEEFVNEKVYDIDTKEKLLDIIQSREPRENFLEFIYDHHTEVEKWHQYYQERSRIRIIEWLRDNDFSFVFEEDLDMSQKVIESLKKHLFQNKVSKDLAAIRKILEAKSKTYYSSEALNPRPKRGRPPKQVAKVEIDLQVTSDYYLFVPDAVQPFLYAPDITSAASVTFSTKFESEEELLESLKSQSHKQSESKLELLSKKLAALCDHLAIETPSIIKNKIETPQKAAILKTTTKLISKAGKFSKAKTKKKIISKPLESTKTEIPAPGKKILPATKKKKIITTTVVKKKIIAKKAIVIKKPTKSIKTKK